MPEMETKAHNAYELRSKLRAKRQGNERIRLVEIPLGKPVRNVAMINEHESASRLASALNVHEVLKVEGRKMYNGQTCARRNTGTSHPETWFDTEGSKNHCAGG